MSAWDGWGQGVGPRARRYATAAALVLSSLVAAVWGTWPLSAHLDTHVWDAMSTNNFVWARDQYMMLWAPAWDVHALTTAPLEFFNANILHPARGMLATHDHLLGSLPLYLPLALASDNPVFAHQATLVLTFACAFLAMAVLVYDWTRSLPAALLAGALYAFCPFRAHKLAWLNMEGGIYLPLIPLLARYAVVRPQRRWPLLLGLTTVLQAWFSYYLGYVAFLSLGLLAAVVFLFDRNARRHWARIVVPTAAGALVVAASLIPYSMSVDDGTFLDTDSVRALSFSLGRTLSAPLAMGLAFFALFWWRRGTLHQIGFAWPLSLFAMALGAHLLALGPSVRIAGHVVSAPYAWLVDFVPGLHAFRDPSRFDVLTTMAVSALAGIAVAGFMRWLRVHLPPRFEKVHIGVAIACVVAAMVSVQSFSGGKALPLRAIETRETVPPVYRWLAEAPRGSVLELPFYNFQDFLFHGVTEAQRVYRSVYHWQPILNGFSGYAPASYRLINAMAFQLPDPKAIERFVEMTGLRYVVIDLAMVSPDSAKAWRATNFPRRTFGSQTLFIVGPSSEAKKKDVQALFGHATPLSRRGQRGSLSDLEQAPLLIAGWPAEASVVVHNQSEENWVGIALPGTGGVGLQYEIRNLAGEVVVKGERSTPLGIDLRPGEQARVPLWIQVPAPAGEYELEVRLFEDEGGAFDRALAPPYVVPLSPQVDSVSLSVKPFPISAPG